MIDARGPRVGVVSLGCAKNLVDTEVMLGHLGRAGCTLVRDPAEADVLLVNTCAFVEEAREESVRAILEAAELKKKGGVRRLVVAGCMVQRYPDEMRASLPEADALVGLDEIERVAEKVSPAEHGLLTIAPPATAPSPAVPSGGPSTFLYDERSPRRRATPPWSAYVKIAEGCDHTCSFCAIPSFRGAFRSRRPQSVVEEARSMADAGVRELNLIAQDSSHYGRDLGLRRGLEELLVLLDAVEALEWIRVHYLYPNTVTDRLIETMARLDRVVKYVDIPLQHAHPSTLRRMRRGGDARGHLELIGRFRDAMAGSAVRTTLIVGFPGETEEEFATLLDFVVEADFDHLGVFTYSHEEGTRAGGLRDDVPAETKRERRARLMEAQQRLVRRRNRARVGETVRVLVEGAHAETEHLLVGRTSTQAMDVDGQVIINDGFARPGDFVDVELTATAGYDLVGRIAGTRSAVAAPGSG